MGVGEGRAQMRHIRLRCDASQLLCTSSLSRTLTQPPLSRSGHSSHFSHIGSPSHIYHSRVSPALKTTYLSKSSRVFRLGAEKSN